MIARPSIPRLCGMMVAMRVLITGAGGMLGLDVASTLRERGHQVVAASRADLDITDADAVARATRSIDLVVNCAAWTAVDEAETNEPAAFSLNATAAQLLARAARAEGAAIAQISTDYVFDGSSTEPYPEDAALAPRSAYGRTKAAGEWAVRAENVRHWVIRTAWLYGAHGTCFPRTIARLAADRDSLDVVADQIGQPTWTGDVATALEALMRTDAPWGTYHATASGSASWYDFAAEVLAAAGSATDVRPTTTAAFPRPAPRPAWSVLGHQRWHDTGIAPIGDWRERWRHAAELVLGAAAPVTAPRPAQGDR